jgi:hypothetical protein
MRITHVIGAAVSLAVLCGCTESNATRKPDAVTTSAIQESACLKETGSRLPGSSASCSATGRSYSSDDLNRTGSTTAAESLRLLDPSITTH